MNNDRVQEAALGAIQYLSRLPEPEFSKLLESYTGRVDYATGELVVEFFTRFHAEREKALKDPKNYRELYNYLCNPVEIDVFVKVPPQSDHVVLNYKVVPEGSFET